jgi:hypothetical protein
MCDVLGADSLPHPCLSGSMADLRRSIEIDMPRHADRYFFKAKYQFSNYLKKYIFQNDVHSASDLELDAYRKFRDTQQRISHPEALCYRPLRASLILQAARKIIRYELLGDYSQEEHFNLCYFGKRSSVGVPYRDSYLDVKSQRLTGSTAHIEWCKEYVRNDRLLDLALGERTPVDCLALTTVPKSWKAHRTIMKNTTLGALYTGGLGKLMVKRAREHGYNINRKSEQHKKVVKRLSISRSHATGDLSSASDSFTFDIICRLFPRGWLTAMNFGRITRYTSPDTVEPNTMASFMTMGIGFTFPAQTIAFYSILEAMRRKLGIQGFVSVFGDDLIYPRTMHPYVTRVFEDLGFILNQDKTYVDEYFRESCGSDYFAGLDVRPFTPEGLHVKLHGNSALSYLYKICNGWLRRWDPNDIPRVLSTLYSECLRFTAQLHQVPMGFPDYAGVKLHTPVCQNPLWKAVHYNRNCSFTFECLGLSGVLRFVPAQIIYLWDHLRSKAGVDDIDCIWDREEDSTSFTWRATGSPCASYHAHLPYEGRKRKDRRRLKPYVARKGIVPHVVVNTKVSHAWL